MRFAHVRPVAVGFVTGGVLVATATGFTVTAAAAQSSLPGITAAGTAGTGQQCEPLKLPAPSASPSPTPTHTSPSPSPSKTPTTSPSATPSATPTQTSTGTGTATTPPPPSGTSTPSPSASTSPAPATAPSPSPSPTASAAASASGSVSNTATASATTSAQSTTATAPATSNTTSSAGATQTASLAAFTTAAAGTSQVSLCVAVQRTQASIERGQVAQWIVSAWTTGGNVPDATVRLVASPASLAPRFSFGCGTRNGTASCDLGAMDAKSSQRELQAQLSVPATATSVTSVKLTVIGSAAHLPKDPTASATVSLTAPTAGLTSGSGTPNVNVNMNTSPLSVSNLPFLPAGSPTLSPGGNAAGLFPTLNPSASGPDPASSGQGQQQGAANAVANTAALPLGASVVGAQLIGLGVLALAFVLAVTRLSIRKRPAVKPAAGPHPESTQSGDKNTPES